MITSDFLACDHQNIQYSDSKIKFQFRPIKQLYIDNLIREVVHIDWVPIFDQEDNSTKTDEVINKLNEASSHEITVDHLFHNKLIIKSNA